MPVMLIGRHFDEPTIYHAAYAFEQSGDWMKMYRPHGGHNEARKRGMPADQPADGRVMLVSLSWTYVMRCVRNSGSWEEWNAGNMATTSVPLGIGEARPSQ